jgi:hypothetical protein
MRIEINSSINLEDIDSGFINDTNKLILKNEKINITNNESILKNKFWMNVYDKMKTIINNYPYQMTHFLFSNPSQTIHL